jgi:hypothetical protein
MDRAVLDDYLKRDYYLTTPEPLAQSIKSLVKTIRLTVNGNTFSGQFASLSFSHLASPSLGGYDE